MLTGNQKSYISVSDRIQSKLYIKGNQGNLKMCLLWAVDLYIEVTNYMHYSLMGKMTNNNYVNANRTSIG